MNYSKITASCLLAFTLWGCNPSTKQKALEDKQDEISVEQSLNDTTSNPLNLPVGDNSQNALDWEGTYFNVIPCRSCEGIEFWLTLKNDHSFEMRTNYLGLNDAREEIFTGTFNWDNSGSHVILDGLIGTYPRKYKVGENQIWYLDKNGEKIEGELADRYILQKK